MITTLLSAAQPHLGGGGDPGISAIRVIASLAICIIVALLAILLIRQRSGKLDLAQLFTRIERRPARIRIVETRRLSPHADICLVEHDARAYLLVLQAGNVRVLNEAPCA